MVNIEVAYATPARQEIRKVSVAEGTSLVEAVRASGICQAFPEIDPDSATLGIFGKAVKTPESTPVRDGDRIEIYRPLLIDPKQARLNRAAKAAKGG